MMPNQDGNHASAAGQGCTGWVGEHDRSRGRLPIMATFHVALPTLLTVGVANRFPSLFTNVIVNRTSDLLKELQ